MKKLSVILLFLIFSVSLAYGQAAKPAVIEMKLAHFAADDHPGNIASKMFAEAVEKRTNGRIKIVIYPNNALGSPPEVLEQNILGAVDMSLPTQGQLGKYSKKFNCVMLPFIFNDYKHADKVLDGPFIKWAVPDLDKAGLVFLSNWEWGFRNLTNSKHPVKNPEDVKGLKIRTPPELPTQAAMEALGAIVATINFNELQMALKQGTIDGQENPIAVIYSNKIYETQKYLTMTGHNYNTMVHVISKKVWDKLTPAEQRIIKEESKKAGDWMRKSVRDAEADQIKQLEKFGMEVTYPDKAKFKALMKPAYDRMKAIAGEDNIAAFIKMTEQAK
ncbi:MAG TPA: TRAP transporter substrate-binding protein [Syntrophorhabdaceae bacterium]|nr:TRAP transporter substrate-binding protein [Syntrophorhabdaceae bacterium]